MKKITFLFLLSLLSAAATHAAYPTYCAPTSQNSGNGYGINSGTIQGGGTSFVLPAIGTSWLFSYEDNAKFSVARGGVIQLSGINGNANTKWSDIYVFVDWNGNGLFTDAGESYKIWSYTGSVVSNLSYAINVPANAALGEIAIRIRSDESAFFKNINPGNPCSEARNGTVHTVRFLTYDGPKVSDGTNTYWYYLKSHGDYSSAADNRAAKVLTKNAAGYYYGVETWNNKSDWAKFKVVAGGAAGTYDIISADGLYLNKGVNGDIAATNPFKSADNANWTFTPTTDSRGCPALRIKNEDGTRFQLKIQSASFAVRTDYTSDENNNLWNFIPADELGFQVSNATNEYWYKLWNLDPETTNGRKNAVLGVNFDNSKLQAAATSPQTWKIIDSGTAGKYYLVNSNGAYASFTMSGANHTVLATPDATCLMELYPTTGVYSSKKDFILSRNFETTGTGVIHLIGSSGSLYTMDYTSQDRASKWAIEPVAGVPSRTINLATSDATLGTAVVAGATNNSITTTAPAVYVSTALSTGGVFKNWTDGATANPYLYTGTDNTTFTANFVSMGAPATPAESTLANPVYYYIYSAVDGTAKTVNAETINAIGKALYSPAAAGKILYDYPGNISNQAYALWAIVNDGGTIKLKNKGSGMYMADSYSVAAANTNGFLYSPTGSMQYTMRNSNTSSFTLAYTNNTIDRWASSLGQNHLTAWYFVAPTYSGTGNWSDAAKWSYGGIPALTTAAVINGDVTLNTSTETQSTAVTVNAGKSLTVNGQFTNNGILTLQSDATNGSATLLTNGGISGSGNTVVQQAVPAVRNWYVSTPVASPAVTNVASTYTYNEPANSWTNPTGMNAGTGYVVAPSVAGIITFSGVPNDGNKTVNLTRTTANTTFSGYNLVGNPYPSQLDWMAVYTSATNIDPTMWYRTNTGTAYAYWTVNSSGVGSPAQATAKIPPMQAFWVRVSSGQLSGTLNLTNAMRSHNSGAANPLKVKQETAQPLVRLQVNNGTNTDETVLYFNANASDGPDVYDSQKLTNGNANIAEIYTLLNNEPTVINGMQNVPYGAPVPLGFSTLTAGSFTISANEFSGFAAGESVRLIDNLLNVTTDLTQSNYTFTVSEPVKTSDRFSVLFFAPNVATAVDKNNQDEVLISVYDGAIRVNTLNRVVDNGKISVYNPMGQRIAQQNITGNHTTLNAGLTQGAYIVKVWDGTKIVCTQKVIVK